MSKLPQGTVRALANLLQIRRSRPEEPSCVLVLGAGASVRSGCPPLMEVIAQIIGEYGNKKVLSRSGEEQIEEFYRVVDGLDDQSLWLVLDRLFKDAQPSAGYEYLARLVKDGYFYVLLSTNVDTLVEKALEREGLSLVDDVDVIDAGAVKTDVDAEPIIRRLENPTPRIKLVKLHGHLPTRQLKFRLKDTFRFPGKLAKVIEGYVSNRLRSVIIVGHSLRDEDLNNCFDIQGEAIWYINPRYPVTSDFAGKVVASRPGSCYIDGEDGDFDRFFDELVKWVQRLTPADEIPPSVGFLNRWNELRDIKARLSLPRYPPVTVVSGPMGYGKTYLLREVADDLIRDRWDCALLECEGLADQDTKAVMSALASEFGCDEAIDWEQLGSYLGQKITEQEKYRAALLVDGIDWLSESVRRQVLMGVNTVYECVEEAKGECRVVVSGRCIRDDLDWLAKEISGEGSLPFGQPGIWYIEIPLSEFGQDVIVDLIRRVARRDFEPWEYEAMSSSLLEITGGHPKGLVDIVTQDLHEERGWTFSKRAGTRRFYFTSDTNERLFTTYMTDVVNEVKAKIGEQWWEDFQAICILRRLNASVLKCLIDKGTIHRFTKGEELLGWLVRRNLVREKQPSMWGDTIARGVVVAEMRMIARNRKRYGELNQIAADSFAESLDKICQVYETTALLELDPPLITYGIELMYHRLEAAKYQPLPQQPEDPLEKVAEEVNSKLMSLGVEIVQKFIKEVMKDNEICPSKEAKDTVTSSFEKRNR
jgi:hypothetical protein